jgi:hypothetical protein
VDFDSGLKEFASSGTALVTGCSSHECNLLRHDIERSGRLWVDGMSKRREKIGRLFFLLDKFCLFLGARIGEEWDL